MNFSIKCETFIRAASICSFFQACVRADVKDKINTVRLENRNGQCFVIATNEKIAMVEILGQTDQADGYTHVKLDEKLLQQCHTESVFNSVLNVVTVEELAIGTVSTTLGYSHPGDAFYWFDETPLDGWRNWFPEEVLVESKGAMHWDVHQVELLMKSSPSGHVIFPEFIDTSQPVILRDVKSENWAGLFIPSDENAISKKATRPEWV